MRTVQVTPVLGLPRVNGWSHVISHPSRGLVIALAVEGRHAGNVGRDLTDYVEANLPGSAQQLYQVAQHIVSEVEVKDCRVQLAAVLLEPANDTSTLTAYQAKVLLKRRLKVGIALSAERRLEVVQGRWRPDDTWVVLTQQADNFVDELVQKLSQGYEVDTVVETLAPGLHRRDNSALSALAFVESGVTGWAPAGGAPMDREPDDSARFDDGARTDSLPLSPVAFGSAHHLVPDPTGPIRDSSFSLDSKRTDQPAAGSKWRALTGVVLTGIGLVAGRGWKVSFGVLAELSRAVGRACNRVRRWSWQRPVYVGQRRQTWKVVLLVLVLSALAVAGWWGWQRYIDRQRQIAAAGQLISPVVAQLDSFSPSRNLVAARRQLDNIINQLESAQARFVDQPAALAVISPELDKASRLRDQLSGSQLVNQLPEVFNLRQVVDDFIVSAAAVGTSRAVFVDQAQRQLIVLDLDNLSARSLELPPDLEVAAVTVASDDSRAWLLADQVWQLELGPTDQTDSNQTDGQPTKSQPEDTRAGDQAEVAPAGGPELGSPSVAINDDDRLAAGRLISSFSNSVYVFTEEGQTIFRYSRDGEKYSPQTWLRSKQGLELDQTTSMSIDGSIWLATGGGQVYKLLNGRPDEFEITGLENELARVTTVATTLESDRLYLLEPGQRRLVVLTKQGEFVREVVSDSLAAASQVIVDQRHNRLLAVNGSQLLEIEL
ncbi:MAG: hypothetical protein COU69_03415 [Candidatus Pacebacteria bacterium CG10_big_fil_rev_8_21_14_0_10_56_10]|nr:MAG: hypothetical protein COU69_03415 [Candidatus Pacebacteria bacterium CG10_big_fil_rev_8_21_14_0_10_56_10]